ncbi:MAG: CRISPR-associated protein Cas5 [Firmicutes bacterium]|nr:CRISPR-associated protein Cas5 [Bacillota bacterium]
MKILRFEVKSTVAHFRRPDTTSTHATYPFMTRTALRGMLAAVMGWDFFEGITWTGLELLTPPVSRVQQLSMLGKAFLDKSGSMFNRPTSIELLINPHYRIYVAGQHTEALAERLGANRSVYHTYLGCAYALTVPYNVVLEQVPELTPSADEIWYARTVLPVHVIAQLHVAEWKQYARVGGITYEPLPGRRFRGSVSVLYEKTGGDIAFTPKLGRYEPPVSFTLWQGKVVALW